MAEVILLRKRFLIFCIFLLEYTRSLSKSAVATESSGYITTVVLSMCSQVLDFSPYSSHGDDLSATTPDFALEGPPYKPRNQVGFSSSTEPWEGPHIASPQSGSLKTSRSTHKEEDFQHPERNMVTFMQPNLISPPREMLAGIQPQFDATQNSFLPSAGQSNPTATLQRVGPFSASENVVQSPTQLSLTRLLDSPMPDFYGW